MLSPLSDYCHQAGWIFRFFTLEPLAHWVAGSYLRELGVFVSDVKYVLVTAATVDIFLLGVLAVANARGGRDATPFGTKMSAPTKGLGVSVIEGSKKRGRYSSVEEGVWYI